MEKNSNPISDKPQTLPYVSVEEAAELVGMSRSAMYVAVRAKEVPAVKIGGTIRISRAALEAFLLAGTLEAV